MIGLPVISVAGRVTTKRTSPSTLPPPRLALVSGAENAGRRSARPPPCTRGPSGRRGSGTRRAASCIRASCRRACAAAAAASRAAWPPAVCTTARTSGFSPRIYDDRSVNSLDGIAVAPLCPPWARASRAVASRTVRRAICPCRHCAAASRQRHTLSRHARTRRAPCRNAPPPPAAAPCRRRPLASASPRSARATPPTFARQQRRKILHLREDRPEHGVVQARFGDLHGEIALPVVGAGGLIGSRSAERRLARSARRRTRPGRRAAPARRRGPRSRAGCATSPAAARPARGRRGSRRRCSPARAARNPAPGPRRRRSSRLTSRPSAQRVNEASCRLRLDTMALRRNL